MTTSTSTASPIDIEMIRKRILDTNFEGDDFFNFVNRGMSEASQRGEGESFKAQLYPILKEREFKLQWNFIDRTELLNSKTFDRIFELDSETREQAIAECRAAARKFHCLTEFNRILRKREQEVAITEQNCEYPFLRRTSTEGGGYRYEINSSKLADCILEQTPCFKVQRSPDESPRFYFYDSGEGYYKRENLEQIRADIDSLLHQISDTIITSSIATQTADMIVMRLQSRNKAEPDERYITFKNGVLDLDTMVLSAFSPHYQTFSAISATWENSEIETPVFDTFLTYFSSGDSEVEQCLLQIFGLIISNFDMSRLKKAMIIFGKPNSGKSVLLRLLSKILSEKNCASMSLQSLEQRFSTAVVFDKRFVFCGDMSPEAVPDMSVFKQMSGGDMLMVESKGKAPFFEKFHGFYMAAANDVPRFGRDSADRESIYQRLILLQAPEPLPAEKRDRNLDEKLYSERDGIIQKAIRAAAPIIRGEQDLIIPERCRQSLSEYELGNSNILEFLHECTEPQDRRNHTLQMIYACYNNFCRQNNYKPLGRNTFSRELAEIYCGGDQKQLFKADSSGKRFLRQIQLTEIALQIYGA